MTMAIEAEGLKREIEGLSKHKQTRRYSRDLQGRVTSWAKGRRAAGLSVPRMCLEVGIGEPTLRRFLEEADGALANRKPAGFMRVKMVEPASAPGRDVVVHGPCGTRLEGLSVSEVAELFRRLACSV